MYAVKPVVFMGRSLKVLRGFPDQARHELGYQLDRVQRGYSPTDWKPMSSIGTGVSEIRVSDSSGAYRVIYIAKFKQAVYVLHAFQKKTQKTNYLDIEMAKVAFKKLLNEKTLSEPA